MRWLVRSRLIRLVCPLVFMFDTKIYVKMPWEMPQLRSTSFPDTKKYRWETNNAKINATYDITKTRLFKYIEIFITQNWKFSDKKKSDTFHTSAQKIACGYSLEPPRRGGSNEYPQSMFLSWSKKINVYLCKPQFYCIKGGLREPKLYRRVFVMNHRHTNKEELQQRNRIGKVCRETTGWGEGGGGERGFKSRDTSPLIVMHFQTTRI